MGLLQVTFVNLLISRKVDGKTWGQTKDSSYKRKGLSLIWHLANLRSGPILAVLTHSLQRLLLKLGECAFLATAPKLWNSLPINFHNEENFNRYKILLKTQILKELFIRAHRWFVNF